jgi:haloalkane dehalogenase
MSSATTSGRPEWLDQAVFPFPSHFVELPQGMIHYVEDGTGPVLLLLHPAPATAFFYKNLLLELRGHFRLIAPDFPGFGLSEPSPSWGATLEGYSRFVNDFVSALRLDDVTLLVTDASGPVGLHAAGRLSRRYQALVLADTFGFPLRGRARLVQFILRYVVSSPPVRWANRRFNLFPWLVTTLGAFRNPLPGADRKAYRRLFASGEQRDRAIDWLRQLGAGRRFLESVEAGIRERLAAKDVLLLYGQFDPTRLVGFPGRFRRLFPRAKTVIIPWEEHFPVLGSAKAVASAILSWRDEPPEETAPCPATAPLKAVP